MSSANLVIRNGTVVDGSGGDPYEADLAVIDGKIAAIGGSIPKGSEEIDARGKHVTPGFVDVHTHYDAQVTWSDRLSLVVERGHDRAVQQLRRGLCAVP
jgi:N-acyl-D-aspartate/D-glutamate deacylase